MGAAQRLALAPRALQGASRRARRAVAALLWLAPALLGAAPGERSLPVPIYGIEIDVRGERERVLVFAEQPLAGRLEARDAATLVLVIPGAVLDPSAPTRVEGEVGGGVLLVSAEESLGEGAPEVHVSVQRAPGPAPELTQQGAILAIEFARPAAPRPDGVSMQFANAELAEVVEAVARATGQRFLHDETLRGTVTLTSAERVTPAEALELLHAALLIKGFAAAPTPSGARKIIALTTGVGGAPWRGDAAPGSGEAPIASLLRLRAAEAQAVATLLQPWLGATALAIAHPPSNALILAGSEARLRGLFALVAAIDQASDDDLVVRRIRHRSASDAAELLRAALGEREGARRGVEAWPDERSGALVLRAPPERMAEARAFLDTLDRPPEGGGSVGVLRLEHADPEALAKLLASLAAGSASGAAGAPALGGALAGRDFSVAVHRPTHSLLVRADPETQDLLAELVLELDRPPPTIAVEALVLEVTSDASLDLGFDAFIPLTRPKSPHDLIAGALLNPSGGGLFQPGAGEGPTYAARFTRAPLVIPIVGPNGVPRSLIVPRETGVITAQDRSVRSQVLMRPQLRMLAGEEQEIFAGSNLPIPVSQATATPGQPFETRRNIERQDVGIRLRVRPSAGEAGDVRLELDVDVTSLAASVVGDVEEVGPTLRQRRLTSTIRLADGELAVVGMAREPRSERSQTGTPFLREIPILGWAFRKQSDTSSMSRLVIAVQARIERTRDETLADSIRQRLAFERSNARVAPLAELAGSAWGLRVLTLADEAQAQQLAARFAASARPARVVRWESSGGPLFDVNLIGFASLSEAGDAAQRLRDEGFDPEVVVPVR